MFNNLITDKNMTEKEVFDNIYYNADNQRTIQDLIFKVTEMIQTNKSLDCLITELGKDCSLQVYEDDGVVENERTMIVEKELCGDYSDYSSVLIYCSHYKGNEYPFLWKVTLYDTDFGEFGTDIYEQFIG